MRPGESVEVDLNSGQRVIGLPLVWERELCLILGRDGQLWQFRPETASAPRPSGTFEVASVGEIKNNLMIEFGQKYDVRSDQSLIVAQPRGAGSKWPDTIDALHRAFQREFLVRGIPLRQGRFPLVAVVFDSQQAFYREVARAGQTPKPGLLGLYSVLSNRMMLYDHGTDGGGVASTIRHEAAHQSAFNLGVHIRLADNPQWFVEGLGTAFEAPGIGSTTGRKDTIWKTKFRDLYTSPQGLAEELPVLLERDETFKRNSDRGYALSWALTAYLLDRMPGAYSRLAVEMGTLLPLQDYPAQRRMSHFRKAIGFDVGTLATNLYRWSRTD
jgi:hypothetical protein